MSTAPQSLLSMAEALADGRLRSRDLVEQALDRVADPQGEGSRTFVAVHAQAARAAADESDRLRKQGVPLPALSGLPASVKDLFDEAGSVTKAGSRVLEDAAPAPQDAPAIANLRKAGLISIGRTSMTEFAFSGVGINPHTGTPANPWERANRRIPGGSSSGAAISVTDGMAAVGIGSDTGGSCRIPAALTGLVGYKPTASRISTAGTVPLSFTLDSTGSLGRTVSCCWAADRALSGQSINPTDAPVADSISAPRLGVLRNYVTVGMDSIVARTYEQALQRLEQAGAILTDVTFPELDTLPEINALGGFPAPESLTWHEKLIQEHGDLYDPFVLKRILRGKEQSAVDYITLRLRRRALIAKAADALDAYDAILMPTVPIIAPRIDDLHDDAVYAATNLLLLRNPTITNFLDRCAISLPCHEHGSAPVGIMAMGHHMRDDHLLNVAAWMEPALGQTPS
ncbi:amidase [Acetobacter cerevisiae]|uniref:Amidase n=1 Tax=Acetobacter cerevisiae TaxID=178900 RepID=A0A149UWD5_9PROT|nr:amidase [Acetobacter cerevisiae]KXV72185.1 amidase [Acetobacter cerevisiae]MCP1246280.1 amidase [Acetobacter cerevisiae]MCP1255778.1 amidase [Acetobacter cerevisiae]